MPTRLGPGKEFDRIRQILEALGPGTVGAGDDAAPIPAGTGELLVSTDSIVEGVHFESSWLTTFEIGTRCAGAALSDLAACGAEGVGMVAALIVPPVAEDQDVVQVMEGTAQAGAPFGIPVLGGDLSRGPVWTVTVTVFGRTPRMVRRDGARVGDSVWVTGALGGARAALAAWQQGRSPLASHRTRFVAPKPRLLEGEWLRDHGAKAMVDVSDGLLGDSRHLAAASQVGIALASHTFPVEPEITSLAEECGLTPAGYAGRGGEDYELLVALPETFTGSDADAFRRETGTPLTRIGEVVKGDGIVLLDGTETSIRGFDHFA